VALPLLWFVLLSKWIHVICQCSMYHSIHGLHTLSKTSFFGSWGQSCWKEPRIAKPS
jgi:hypothetical protein